MLSWFFIYDWHLKKRGDLRNSFLKLGDSLFKNFDSIILELYTFRMWWIFKNFRKYFERVNDKGRNFPRDFRGLGICIFDVKLFPRWKVIQLVWLGDHVICLSEWHLWEDGAVLPRVFLPNNPRPEYILNPQTLKIHFSRTHSISRKDF